MTLKNFPFSKQITIAAALLVPACSLYAGDAIRVSDADAQKSIVSKVRPEFPAIAKQMKLSGRVVVDLTVAEDGKVEKADVVSGNPILGNAAKNAAKQWTFRPFQENGKVSEAIVRINFDFAN
ncbi:MAG TPA: energy transducer TonB [Bryobacteraceae bacterium]|jgi:protein TonB|nr:energy transducer TonB [Bryobacteraceae bacterium]